MVLMMIAYLLIIFGVLGFGATQGGMCIGKSCDTECFSRCSCPVAKPHCVHTATGTSECAEVASIAHPILFIHIPKTGGTTFTYAVSAAFGADTICNDYGVKKSAIVRKFFDHTEMPDPYAFARAAAGKCSLVSGHIKARKYVAAFGLRSTVTLLRIPLQRMISEFWHKKAQGYTSDWKRWVGMMHMNNASNRYTGILSADVIPIQAYGFVGLTEQYSQSLDLFNAGYGAALKMQTANERAYETPPDASEFDEHLGIDNTLYATAKAVFTERLRIVEACKPYAHGAIDHVEGNMVRGWAWWARSDQAVLVRILIDGEDKGTADAVLPHRLLEYGAPRKGYVGWVFVLSASDRPRTLRCEVATTGQLLGEMSVPANTTQPSTLLD